MSSKKPGASHHAPMALKVTAAPSAWLARDMYWSVDIDDECGVSAMPITRVKPSRTKDSAVSSSRGGSYLEPKRTSNLPGEASSSADAIPSTWAAVRWASGEMPPMAS